MDTSRSYPTWSQSKSYTSHVTIHWGGVDARETDTACDAPSPLQPVSAHRALLAQHVPSTAQMTGEKCPCFLLSRSFRGPLSNSCSHWAAKTNPSIKALTFTHTTCSLTPFLPGSSVLWVSYKWTCSWIWNRNIFCNCMFVTITKLFSPGLDLFSTLTWNQEREDLCTQMTREGGSSATESNR